MNLITRFTLLFGFVSLIVFPIGGYITYRIVKQEVESEEQRFLLERLERIRDFIERTNPHRPVTRIYKSVITPLADSTRQMEPVFSDTLVMHETLERLEPHLKLDNIIQVNGRAYYVMLYDLIVESDDIVDSVTESMIKMYLILLAGVVMIGLVGSYYIFKPFRETLQRIRAFRLQDAGALSFPATQVAEFRRLHIFLTEMTQKMQQDYVSLKEFSENASHELQTPIAIVQGKLDVLLETRDLSEEQLKLITTAQSAVRRLSRLSQSLALLTKIENREFGEKSNVDLMHLAQNLLAEFEELIALKQIELTSRFEPGAQVIADPVLIEVLMTNLINNAVRHNTEGGKIHFDLNREVMLIKNSGSPLQIDPDELFERFKKSNQSQASLGLGLAIVKKICGLYGYDVSYAYQDEMHEVSVRFAT